MYNRRQKERFDLELPLKVAFKNKEGILCKEDTQTINISSKGAFLLFRNFVKKDSRHRSSIFLPVGQAPTSFDHKDELTREIELTGKVLRIENKMDDRQGIAVSFESQRGINS